MSTGDRGAHPGATLTPHFRDFLPGWVARQAWFAGTGVPALTAVGFFRLEDPAGEVGIETHLVTDGSALYQIPMTYRGAALESAAGALIATAEHSILGARWIYDAPADPVWAGELLRLVRESGVTAKADRPGSAQARGCLLPAGDLADGPVAIELVRVLTAGGPAAADGAAGLVLGTWQPGGPGTAEVTGTLAVLRRRAARGLVRAARDGAFSAPADGPAAER
jgi:Maltokinase N-terminal cap domain